VSDLPDLDHRDLELLVSRSVDGPVELEVLVTELFEALGLVEAAAEPPLAHQIDAEAIEALYRRGGAAFRLTVALWGHVVVFEPDRIRVFDPV
jgi:hypothetical protein